MEKIAKATILGQLLQPAVCCLNDSNLRTLPLADALIGDLVVLTVVASKVRVIGRNRIKVYYILLYILDGCDAQRQEKRENDAETAFVGDNDTYWTRDT